MSSFITPAQCRAARALLNMTIDQLYRGSVSPRLVIEAFEAGEAKLKRANLDAIRHALRQAGVVFFAGNGGKIGVRLKS